MADGRVRRTTVEDIDRVKSLVQRKIILYMRRDMTKSEIERVLSEEYDVKHLVTNLVWEELEPLNKEYFAAYRARLRIPKPSGSLSQTGAPLALGPPINWQEAKLPIEPLVLPWSTPQGPSCMEDPGDILDCNLSRNVAIMHGADPSRDFDFSGIFLEPKVNPLGLVGEVPRRSLSDIRADIPGINGTDIIESYSESLSFGAADAHSESSVQQQVNVENVENMSESESDESDGNSKITDIQDDSYVSTGRTN